MERIIKKQDNLEGQLTKLQTTITAELAKLTSSKVTVYVQNLEKLWEKAEKYNDEIAEDCATEEETKKQVDKFNALFAIYCDLRSKLLHLETTLAVPASSSGSTSSAAPPPQRRVKLPQLELASFNGKYEEWISFQDSFTNTIHDDPTLGDSEKLKYLKEAVKGDAKSLIHGLQITNSNYTQAWKLLRDRYHNEREITTCVMKRLFGQSSVSKDSAQSLQLLLDTTNECLATLKALGRPTDKWDDIIVFYIVDNLDVETRRQWAMKLKGTSLPTYEELQQFIERHIRGLHASSSMQVKPQPSRPAPAKITVSANHGSADVSCGICKTAHPTYKCEKLRKASITQRMDLVRTNGLCFNCLRPDHRKPDCTSTSRCRQCNKPHHSLLHQDRGAWNAASQQSSSSTSKETPATVTTNLAAIEMEEKEVLLSTAVVMIMDKYGAHQLLRVLIDNGSQATIVSEKAMSIIGMPRRRSHVMIRGIADVPVPSRGEVNLRLHSRLNGDYIDVTGQILSKLSRTQPRQELQQHEWQHTRGLQLADPKFHVPDGVDILLGADYYGDIIRDGIRRGEGGGPNAQLTIFGWILMGPVLLYSQQQKAVCVNLVETCDTDKILTRFWEVEEVGGEPKKPATAEEEECEKHFMSTHTRDKDGKFIVQLPIKNISNLGFSRQLALNRWKGVERRLLAKPEVQQSYNKFMNEYIQLGHMELIPPEEVREIPGKTSYLPHHYVFKDEKIRVVFDGSAKTTSGASLNDCLMVGPTLQDDVHELLLRFRKHQIAVKADVVKMFRQYKMSSGHSDLQRIIWREAPDQPLRDYRLITVTYGTASAPFTATRCLQQAAKDCSESYPSASATLLTDTFVDDVMSGRDSLAEAKILQQQLISLLSMYGMELSKWASNSSEFMNSLPEDKRGSGAISFDSDNPVKALGVQWNHVNDCFYFCVSQTDVICGPTKRQLSSELGKIFDPLGLLSPFVVRAKMLLQEVWKLKTGWDDIVPDNLIRQWLDLNNERSVIQTITIPRCVFPNSVINYDLIAFCDSSEKAYGCAVYLRSKMSSGDICVHLVTSKAKVAPMQQESLPRLELLGALMCSKLVTKVKCAMQLTCEIYCYTDSTIVLHWIRGFPGRWKCFVGNRVAKIQKLVEPERWSHVVSADNPADALSRGLSAEDLKSSDLWWQGPSWLKNEERSNSPPPPISATVNLEERKQVISSHHVACDLSMIDKYSSLIKLQRVTAYQLRFAHNCKNEDKVRGPLSPAELHGALYVWIKQVQSSYFASEIDQLKKRKLSHKNKLAALNPFISSDGILRVGGRIQRADVPESQKFPAILPHDSRLVQLIIEHYHRIYLHAGYQLLWCNMQREFWILKARSVIRKIVRKCVTCRRHRADLAQQQMGNLPSSRVTITRCFVNTGVDYAGPFSLRVIIGRSTKIMKGYFAIFICMATKAVHLEAVKDLSTDAFIAAFTRFSSRRGIPANVYSDCGTNFQGADRVLQQFWSQAQHQEEISNATSSKGVKWHFNAPSAPHHGGLWEAGVKSAKHHLKREIGSNVLTYDEFETILCQVESCLNSRPLSPMSNDPNDLNVLTPAHFLVGEPLTAIPHPDLGELKTNRLSRWQRTTWITQHFWNRWRNEYLSSLQERQKWTRKEANLEVGDLVLIKDDNLAPLQWKMGRIIEVHSGTDDLVRVVDLKTMTGELKRPIHKLCPLLKNNEDE